AHVVEGRGVFSTLTVEENLTLAFRQRGGRGKLAENLERAYQAFPILGERHRQTAGTLSGGQQRLLSLAKVLVVPPKVLVADELSLGLAPVVVDAVYEGLVQINGNGTALVVVEQQVHRVLELATWAVVLDHGSVVYEGEPGGASAAVEALMVRREEAALAGVAEAEAESDAAGAAHDRRLRGHLPHLRRRHDRETADADDGPGAGGEPDAEVTDAER
ncbi:MAG TPA: ATP-binding cassette domain-containing protein, partial [Acidimicrobiales bacterium]|nr:ATP-binding cassette domain-containing protein [Acidimicrobiales bacterium]